MEQRFAERDAYHCTSGADAIQRRYFFLPEAKLGCHDAVF